MVKVTSRINNIPGTSAQLQNGDILTLYDLLYGLMLPSGNDASVMIADTVGKLIQRHKKTLSRRTYY
jgi:D-alanyl-D-alanine carboxypeptidase